MLEDLGNPSPRALAKALDVTPRTVSRWIADPENTPRPVMLSLFWLTRWGQSQVDCEAVNTARMYRGFTESLRTENARLKNELARLVSAGDFGCANDPTLINLRPVSAEVVKLPHRARA